MHIYTVLAHLGQMIGLGYDGGERFLADEKLPLNFYQSVSIGTVMYVCMHAYVVCVCVCVCVLKICRPKGVGRADRFAKLFLQRLMQE
jgi:hypothetical protein